MIHTGAFFLLHFVIASVTPPNPYFCCEIIIFVYFYFIVW